jgi:hypothetical protein
MDPAEVERQARDLQYTSGKRFFAPETQHIMPKEDFFLSIIPDRFPFVIRAERKDGFCEMERSEI